MCTQGGVSPGCSLIVNGGSGSLGSLAAQIALTMGAAKVWHLLVAELDISELPASQM